MNTIIELPSVELPSVENTLPVLSVDSLFQELVVDFQHFKSYNGFKKWLSVIPDELLTQLVDRLIQSSHITQTSKPVVLLTRPELENILRIRLMRFVTDYIHKETKIATQPGSSIMRIQGIYKIYSIYIPFLDLFRACFATPTVSIYHQTLKNQLQVCDRLEKEMMELTVSYVKISNSYTGLLSCFKEVRQYVENYEKELAEYNREIKYLLLMRLKLNRDLFLYITSFMGNHTVPFI